MGWFLPLWGIGGLISCCELPPPGLILQPPPVPIVDTCYLSLPAPAPDPKVVVLEEFTGVHCSNCPAAHVEVQNILANKPVEQVVAVAIHNSSLLAEPYPPPQPDFRTPEGIAISDLVGGGTMPSGVIDRQDFDNDGTPTETKNEWSSYIDTQLAETPVVNVDVSIKNYDPGTRLLIAHVKLHFLQTLTDTLNISVMVTESDMVAWQLQANLTIDSNYVHNHVLRGMMTSHLGSLITCSTEAGRVIEKDFTITLGAGWKPENCEVVAFVNEVNGMNILQAGFCPVQ